MRSRAYGRVMRGLESRSALERLSSEARETLREAADTLVLARSTDGDSDAALAAARAVLVSIRRDQIEPWIEQLADDLEDAGPPPIALFATPAYLPAKQREGSASR
ncbi:MAG TPA: hypothetical protein VEF89_29015 [Solirubrobacteraceae bacterium]|nr:hypothetical protein [Solirubrobacteraceae bacterium]